jgi:hypothetical protein
MKIDSVPSLTLRDRGYTSTEILLLIFLKFSKVFKHVSEKLLLDRIHIQISYSEFMSRATRTPIYGLAVTRTSGILTIPVSST